MFLILAPLISVPYVTYAKEVRHVFCHIVLDGVPALRERGTATPRLFGPCLLWTRSPISATAELLLTNPKNLPAIFLYRVKRQSCQRSQPNSNGVTPNGVAKQRWGRLKGHSGASHMFLCPFKSAYIWYNFTMKMILLHAAVI